MTEPTLPQLIEKFNIISTSLSSGKFEYPQLEIKMRMNWDELESVFYASLTNVEVKDGCILEGTYGNGATPEEAIRDYYKQIVGKNLVYRAMNKEYRREYVVVG